MRGIKKCVLLGVIVTLGCPPSFAFHRLVILKFDGLPADFIERFVREENPATGRSYLPWIKRIFYEEGVTFENFYVRGLSESGPSWTMLGTGQHQSLKSNVELDRATGRVEDYLNILLGQMEMFTGRRVNPRPVEVLDELGIPLMEDAYDFASRRIGLELVRRGTSWLALAKAGKEHFGLRSAEDLLVRLLGGADTHGSLDAGNQRHLLDNLRDPRIEYLSAYFTVFDHTVHPSNNPETLHQVARALDATIGRIYTALRESPRADDTLFVVVSDHGMNTHPDRYSQGFNLVSYFTRAAWGGHHVLTKRAALHDFQFRSLNFAATSFVNPSRESLYLKGRTEYPTLFIDYDGNERAALHLRNSDLNLLHLLLIEMKKKHPPRVIHALTEKFFERIEAFRPAWRKELEEITEELAALERIIAARRQALRGRQGTTYEAHLQIKDEEARLKNLQEYHRQYDEYRRRLATLLSLRRETFALSTVKVEDLIRPRTFGPRNSIYQLQNYVVGLSERGITLGADGRLDEEASFRRINYLTLLTSHKVLNNVQLGVSPHPVDFLAISIPYEAIASAVRGTDLDTGEDVIWLYGSEEHQALLVARGRRSPTDRPWLKYVPIARLRQSADGTITFDRIPVQANLPLRLWEDPHLAVEGDRAAWFEAFHSDTEWIAATHRTAYAIAVVALHEYFDTTYLRVLDPQPNDRPDEVLLKRFTRRRRLNSRHDLEVFANDLWNFNIRDFNPGGNHGGLRRRSTHSVLMMWGGPSLALKAGYRVTTPYDSLMVVPTLMELLGITRGGVLPEDLRRRGFRSFPGPIAWEIFSERSDER